MNTYCILLPSVYGEWGDDTVIDATVHPPIVYQLHFVLDSPPHDDLHTSFPSFFVSGRLGRQITETGLTGARLEEFKIELNEQYLEDHPNEPTPEVLWLKVYARAQEADFGLDLNSHLVVSDAAMKAIRLFRLDECLIYDAGNPPTSEQMTKDLWEHARQRLRPPETLK